MFCQKAENSWLFYKLLSEFCVQVKLVNIRNDDIADGNPKLTLGLIWTIILHFQVKKMDTLSLGVFTGKNLTIRYIVTSGSSSSVFSQTTETRTRSMLTQRSLSLNENLCSVFILCAAAVVVHTWSWGAVKCLTSARKWLAAGLGCSQTAVSTRGTNRRRNTERSFEFSKLLRKQSNYSVMKIHKQYQVLVSHRAHVIHWQSAG